jgi:AcrR family transcriptional regulator
VNQVTPRRPVSEELSREGIMEVASDLFVNKGYRLVSMREIAKVIGCSHGAIYYHFKDKAELFSALIARDFNHLTQLLQNTLERTDNLEDIFLDYLRFGLENRNSYEIMFLIQDDELQQYIYPEKELSYSKFAEAVTNRLSETTGKQIIDIKIPWVVFISLHGFVTYYIHLDQNFEDLKSLAEAHVDLLIKGLKSMV